MKKISIQRSVLITLVAGAFAIGVFLGAGSGLFRPLPSGKQASSTDSLDGSFQFIQSVATPKALGGPLTNQELMPFQYKVRELVEERLQGEGLTAVAVYFRDLNNGNWFGIGESERFSSKDQLKLPVMIAYFKWSETNPLLLRKRLSPTGGVPATGSVPPRQDRIDGAERAAAINDLIFRMIAHDDKEAYVLLTAYLPAPRLERVFRDLNVDYNPRSPDEPLSLKAYAAFYRVLFNASYLNEEMSERALRYLSRSSFREGMAAGVPQNVIIASKRGERRIPVEGANEELELLQLHEFGIIYHAQHPFLLGIMARGDGMQNLTRVIRDVTRLVYEEVDHQSGDYGTGRRYAEPDTGHP